MRQQLYDEQNLKHVKKEVATQPFYNEHKLTLQVQLLMVNNKKTNVKTFLQHYNITDLTLIKTQKRRRTSSDKSSSLGTGT